MMTKTTSKNKIPWLLEEELNALKLPDDIMPDKWAEKFYVLDSKSNPIAGNFNMDITPYLRQIVNTFADNDVEVIVVCSGAQLGKTSFIFITLLYSADQDPSPILLVYPSKEDAEDVSEERLKPAIENCRPLKRKFMPKKSSKVKMQFHDMYMALVGSFSPNKLASRPVKRVYFDETDKYPGSTEKESDPISLGMQRTKNYPYSRKVVMTSTPTTESGTIWTHLMDADVILQFFVPCPHCGEHQTFKIKQIKWPEELKDLPHKQKRNKVEKQSWYECEHCHGKIRDQHKPDMMIAGQWKPVAWERGEWISLEVTDEKHKKVGYQINSIYSPFQTFGKIAEKWVDALYYAAKGNFDPLQDFINSELGEPWRDPRTDFKKEDIKLMAAGHERGVVPDKTILLTAGVDVQQDHFWFTVRAWGEKETSWLVDYGRVEYSDGDDIFEQIEFILLNRYFEDKKGRKFMIKRAFIDAGYRTEDVYRFCAKNYQRCRPAKGASTPQKDVLTYSKIKKGDYGSMQLAIVDTVHFKDYIFAHLRRGLNNPGAWMLYQDCSDEFIDQLTSEIRVTKKNRKKKVTEERYELISSGAANHLLDCSVYDAAAADSLGIRYVEMRPSAPPQRKRGVISKGITQ